MLTVDWAWTYAFGAGFAACAARQLKKEEKPFDNQWYVFTLTFFSVFFVPACVYLLWEHPQWESAQLAKTFTDLPAWLVTGYAVTNVTQGILGFWVSFKLIKKGNYYAAHANWMAAWILMWFLAFCGWDCTGYQRWLYDMSVNNGQYWTPGTHMGVRFFYASKIWWTLVVMGIFFVPMLIHGSVSFVRNGFKEDPSIPAGTAPGPIRILAVVFGAQYVVCLGLAILATLCVMGLRNLTGSTLTGYLIGVPLFSIATYVLLFRRGMPMNLIARQLYVKEPGE